MNNPARTRCRKCRSNRHGFMSLEAVCSLIVVVLPAGLLFLTAVVACRNLYGLISSLIGSPYL